MTGWLLAAGSECECLPHFLGGLSLIPALLLIWYCFSITKLRIYPITKSFQPSAYSLPLRRRSFLNPFILLVVAIIFGIHSVEEALAARGRGFEYIAIASGRGDNRLQKITQLCRAAGVPVRSMPRDQLTRLANTASHQGVVAVTAEKQYGDLDDLLKNKRGQHSFLIVLDGVEDPHNLGAIIRTAEGAGADGIVIPERRAAGVTATVVKSSAGASEYVPVAKVTNISRAIEEIKSHNIWTVGLDERGGQAYDRLDYKMDCALVLGAEGHGLHQHVKEKCDFLVSIPMLGKIASLNVSVAAGIVMYEVARQRRIG
jgi:23S rRNA (guanosine2251-2'-O)-methyltransferase